MDTFFGTLPIIVFIVLILGLWVNHYMQHERVKAELYKLVRQTGGQNISIESDWWGKNNVYLFRLAYRDLNGKWQERQVSRQRGSFGQAQGEFMWDHPLVSEPDTQLSSRLSSKEQIISDMDAEIKRLQQELEKAHKEN